MTVLSAFQTYFNEIPPKLTAEEIESKNKISESMKRVDIVIEHINSRTNKNVDKAVKHANKCIPHANKTVKEVEKTLKEVEIILQNRPSRPLGRFFQNF